MIGLLGFGPVEDGVKTSKTLLGLVSQDWDLNQRKHAFLQTLLTLTSGVLWMYAKRLVQVACRIKPQAVQRYEDSSSCVEEFVQYQNLINHT